MIRRAPPSVFDRRRHARQYLLVIRPALLALGAAMLLISYIVRPEAITDRSFLALSITGVSILLTLVLYRVSSLALLTRVTLAVDTTILVVLSNTGIEPRTDAIYAVIPLLGFAYFESARTTTLVATCMAAGAFVMDLNEPSPSAELFVPDATAGYLFIGILLALGTHAMHRNERQYSRLVRDQWRSLTEAQLMLRNRDRLMANISHELRTPLTANSGFIETLLREDIDVSQMHQRQILTYALDGAKELMSLVDDMASLQSIEPSQLHYNNSPISVVGLIEAVTSARDLGPDRRIIIDINRDNPPCLRCDQKRISRALNQIVENAISHGKGEIIISAATVEQSVSVTVCDHGPGVDAEASRLLFEPFSVFSDSPESTGLGLAISRAIVEAHGGRIDYQRTADSQTQFNIILPCEPPDYALLQVPS